MALTLSMLYSLMKSFARGSTARAVANARVMNSWKIIKNMYYESVVVRQNVRTSPLNALEKTLVRREPASVSTSLK